MIEVTVRDGRLGRDRTQDSPEGGAILATLQRDVPYDIGDVITLANGEAVVVIGDNQQIQPGASWTQNVFVGNLNKPRPQIIIDLGSCPDWTLQDAGPSTTTFVRCIGSDEAEQIIEAARFCRQYATMPSHRLLNSSYRVWQQAFARVASAKKGELRPELTEELLGAFVGWILIWRLIFDQAEHDLSSRFGRNSDQLTKFRLARNAAYDGSQAYRVIEAIRNLVQHQGMPPLRLTKSERLDRASGQVAAKVSYKFPVSYLLGSSKCKATVKNEFRGNPELELELPSLIDEAMTALTPVLLELTKISTPEVIAHVRLLRRIFTEASGAPLLLRLKPPLAGSKLVGLDFEMAPLHDLQFLVQNMPIPGAAI